MALPDASATHPVDLVDQGDVQALLDEFSYEINVVYVSSQPSSQLQSCSRCIALTQHDKLAGLSNKLSTWETYSKLATALTKASTELSISILILGLLLLRSSVDKLVLENFSTQFLQAVLEVHVTCVQNNRNQPTAQGASFHAKRKLKGAETNASPHAQSPNNPHSAYTRQAQAHPVLQALKTLFGDFNDDLLLLQAAYANRYFTLLVDCVDASNMRSEDPTHADTHAPATYNKLVRCLQEAQGRSASYMSASVQKHLLACRVAGKDEDVGVIGCLCVCLDSLHIHAFREVMHSAPIVRSVSRDDCEGIWALFKDLHEHPYSMQDNHAHHSNNYETYGSVRSSIDSKVHPAPAVSLGDADLYTSLLKCLVGVCSVSSVGPSAGPGMEGSVAYLQDFVYVLDRAQEERRKSSKRSVEHGQEYEKFLLEVCTSALSLLCNLVEMYGHTSCLTHTHPRLWQRLAQHEVGVDLHSKHPALRALDLLLSPPHTTSTTPSSGTPPRTPSQLHTAAHASSRTPKSRTSTPVQTSYLPPYISFLCGGILAGGSVFMQDLLDTHQDFVTSAQPQQSQSLKQITNGGDMAVSQTDASKPAAGVIPLSDIVYTAYLTMHLITCILPQPHPQTPPTQSHTSMPTLAAEMDNGSIRHEVHNSSYLLMQVRDMMPRKSFWLLTRTVNAYMSIQCQTGLSNVGNLAPWLKLARLLGDLDAQAVVQPVTVLDAPLSRASTHALPLLSTPPVPPAQHHARTSNSNCAKASFTKASTNGPRSDSMPEDADISHNPVPTLTKARDRKHTVTSSVSSPTRTPVSSHGDWNDPQLEVVMTEDVNKIDTRAKRLNAEKDASWFKNSRSSPLKSPIMTYGSETNLTVFGSGGSQRSESKSQQSDSDAGGSAKSAWLMKRKFVGKSDFVDQDVMRDIRSSQSSDDGNIGGWMAKRKYASKSGSIASRVYTYNA
eukprot:gene29887-36084_t